MKKKILSMNFKYVILFLALSVAGCAAYFSIWGLSQLFAGASFSVIIMATILEISKIVTTTTLHNYWDKLARALKVYLTTSVIILMVITSVGIYGFLSNAYQITANKLDIHESEIKILEAKKNSFTSNITDNQNILQTKKDRLNVLTNIRANQENRIDNGTNSRLINSFRRDIQNANDEVISLNKELDIINGKNSILTDSVNKYNTKILELKSTSKVSAEIGPLKYISELTKIPMANVVNYLILLLIFVFDPLAVALILTANKVFEIQQNKKNENKDESLNNSDDEVVTTEVENLVADNKPVQKNKIELEDIKEIKESNRGFSVNIPKPKTNNNIERISTNKIIKDNNDNTFFYNKKR